MLLLKQISLFIPNEPGSLARVCRVLKEKNVNISTLSLAETERYGILRLLIKEYEKARQVLEAAGFVAKLTDVLAVKVPNYAGGMAEVVSVFEKHNIQIEYIYAFASGAAETANIVVRVENPEAVVAALQNEPVKLIGPEEIF